MKEIVAVDGAVSSTSTVKTVVGGFVDPLGMAVDGSGDVFVADAGNGVVKVRSMRSSQSTARSRPTRR